MESHDYQRAEWIRRIEKEEEKELSIFVCLYLYASIYLYHLDRNRLIVYTPTSCIVRPTYFLHEFYPPQEKLPVYSETKMHDF